LQKHTLTFLDITVFVLACVFVDAPCMYDNLIWPGTVGGVGFNIVYMVYYTSSASIIPCRLCWNSLI